MMTTKTASTAEEQHRHLLFAETMVQLQTKDLHLPSDKRCVFAQRENAEQFVVSRYKQFHR